VNYALVGLFVVLLGSAFGATVVWLSATRVDKVYDTYVAYFSESVSGLNVKAPVKYRGVDVGRVNEIALDRDDPERVRLILDIERGAPIKVDTVAVLATQGITGLAYVDLTGGSRGAAPLTAESGRLLPEIQTAPSFLMRIDTAVSGLLAQLAQATSDLSSVAERFGALLARDNMDAVSGILRNLEVVSGVLAQRTNELGGAIGDGRVALGNLAQASAGVPELVNRLNRGATALEQTVVAMGRTSSGVDQVLGETRRELARASGETMTQLSALLIELQQLTRTLQRLGSDLERDPQSLLFGRGRRAPGPGE
jgi:phospholipid/cholesterol/gamma-HCH transport system substrate-binding protein